MPDFPAKKERISLVKTILLLLAVFIGARMLYWHLFLPFRATASDLTLESIISAINRERSLRNLVALNTDARLSSAAQSKSEDMQARHYFSHTDPEGNYIWPKIVAAGYTPYLQLGENLAIEFYSTESLVNAWMNSPTHRANILNEGFKDQGMGLEFGNADTGQYHSAIANTFGTLSVKKTSAAPAVKSENTTPSPSAPVATPPKTVQPKPPTQPIPQTAPEVSAPTPEPAPATNTELPKTTPNSQLAIRGNGDSGYALPQDNTSQPTSTTASGTPEPKPESPVKASVKAPQSKESKNPMDATRYLSLILTALIVIFIVSDIKDAFENKLAGLDKKINNLVLLILALVVLFFLYWL